jgi:hypothetical protein
MISIQGSWFRFYRNIYGVYCSQEDIDVVRNLKNYNRYADLVHAIEKEETAKLVEARKSDSNAKPFREPSTFYGKFKEAHYHDSAHGSALRRASLLSSRFHDMMSDMRQGPRKKRDHSTLGEKEKEKSFDLLYEVLNEISENAWPVAFSYFFGQDQTNIPLVEKIHSLYKERIDEGGLPIADIAHEFQKLYTGSPLMSAKYYMQPSAAQLCIGTV